jgi:hypothetical protein
MIEVLSKCKNLKTPASRSRVYRLFSDLHFAIILRQRPHAASRSAVSLAWAPPALPPSLEP